MTQQDTVFAALTSALGEGLALFGGARATRVAQAASRGDAQLQVESTEGLPQPGQVSCGRVTYRYTTCSPRALLGLTALVGGAELPGCLADHPVGAAVLDVSGTFSQLDLLRRQLFLDTATGASLADLGRSLGVLRSPTLSSDDQYRAVVKSLAYARRGTVAALRQLLDALLGAGNYTLDENPFAHPGTVVVGVRPDSQQQRTTLGRTYTENPAPVQPQAGAFPQALPAFGHGALQLADPQLSQDLAASLPSALPTDPWSWTGSSEAAQVRLLPTSQGPGPCTTLVGLAGAYAAEPLALQVGAHAELGLFMQVVSPSQLASDGLRAGALLHDGQKVARWGARAADQGWQLALVDNAGIALSTWAVGPLEFSHITLQLTPRGASLRVAGRLVGQVARAQLPSVPANTPRAAWGNPLAAGQPTAVRWQVRQLNLSVRPGPDLWLGRGTGAQATAASQVRLPGAQLLPRHVGHALWLDGPASAAAARGRYVVQQAQGELVTLQGQPRTDGALEDGNPTAYFLAPASQPFTFPDDLGKSLVITSGSASMRGTYRIAALYDPTTGADLATLQTPGLQVRALRARLQGGRVTAGFSLDWRLDPSFASQQGLAWLLEDAGQVAVADGVQLATPWQPLPSAAARYTFLRRRVLGGQVRLSPQATNRVADVGPPVRLRANPLYATDQLGALDTYLPQAGAAGTRVQVTYQ